MKCITNGKIVLEDKVVESQVVIFNEKIVKIAHESQIDVNDYEIIDAKGNFVLPGLIDMHIHGYLGADASDGDADGIRKIAMGSSRTSAMLRFFLRFLFGSAALTSAMICHTSRPVLTAIIARTGMTSVIDHSTLIRSVSSTSSAKSKRI